MPQPHLRAADADRAAVATLLGEHMAAGRLSLEEFDERLTRAYAARTFGELDELTADLPPTAAQWPQPAVPGTIPAAGRGTDTGHEREDLRAAWRGWLTTALIVLTIWAATSLAAWQLLYFWPVWVIGPWGAVLLARTITGGRGERPGGDRQLKA